jgi:hypothetical protein
MYKIKLSYYGSKGVVKRVSPALQYSHAEPLRLHERPGFRGTQSEEHCFSGSEGVDGVFSSQSPPVVQTRSGGESVSGFGE